MKTIAGRELERPWVVWSEEHGGWWRPGEHGYTHSLKEAGRFSMERAFEIEKNANKHLRNGVVNEVAMTDPMWPKANKGEP
jgi:hypothetical protein